MNKYRIAYWERKSLNELGYVSRGRSRHRPRDAPHLYGGPYPFIQTGDVKHAGLYISDYSQTYSESGLEQSKLWNAGTLCITIAANIADTAILKFDACFPDSIIGFIPDPNKSDARFIKYLFDSILKARYQRFTQGAAQDNLSQAKLLSIKIPVPDVNIQIKIAEILSSYDNLIENNHRRIQLLEEAARLLYQEWFVRLRFPGHEHIRITDGVPEGWENGCVSDFYDTTSGGTPSRRSPDFFTGDINWVKTQELNGGYIFDSEEKITENAINHSAAKLLPKNTVLVAMYGATIGELAILASAAACNQACCAIIPKDKISNEIFAYLFFRENKSRLKSLSQGAAQNNINQQIIRNFPMIIPSQTVMILFLSYLNPIMDSIKIFTMYNKNLIRARDLLLPRLMNGAIAV